MPVTIQTIKEHLATLNLTFEEDAESPDEVLIFFETNNYTNAYDGEKRAAIVCQVAEEGQYLAVFVPLAESLKDCRYKGAALAAMGEIAYRTRHAQLEYDPTDQEVRVSVDIPVMDNTVTALQLHQMLSNVLFVLNTFQPVLHHAMETGKVDMSLIWEPKEESPS